MKKKALRKAEEKKVGLQADRLADAIAHASTDIFAYREALKVANSFLLSVGLMITQSEQEPKRKCCDCGHGVEHHDEDGKCGFCACRSKR